MGDIVTRRVLGAYEPRDVDNRGAWTVTPPGVRGDQASTAALAVVILTRGDENQNRLLALAADSVGEVVIVDLEKRSVDWLAVADGEYGSVERSGLIELGADELAARIEWP